MSDPNDPRHKRSEKLAADLFLDEEDDGTVPDRDLLATARLATGGGPPADPPTIPIDMSGFQEAPLPEISFPVKETSATRGGPPLAFPPRETSASRMSSSPPPAAIAFPAKETSARSGGLQPLPPQQQPPSRSNIPALQQPPPQQQQQPPSRSNIPAIQQPVPQPQQRPPSRANIPTFQQPLPPLQATGQASSSRPNMPALQPIPARPNDPVSRLSMPAVQPPRPNDPAISGSRIPDATFAQRIRDTQPNDPQRRDTQPNDPSAAQRFRESPNDPGAAQRFRESPNDPGAVQRFDLPISGSRVPDPALAQRIRDTQPNYREPPSDPAYAPRFDPPISGSRVPDPALAQRIRELAPTQPTLTETTQAPAMIVQPSPMPAAPAQRVTQPPIRAPLHMPPAIAPLPIALPARILVLDDDTRAAATIASRLLELGYGVRAARWSEAKAALAESDYDAIVGEIPADETRTDAGKSRIDPLLPTEAPFVLTSSAVFRIDLLRDLPPVASALTKPFFVEVLVSSIEAARTKIGIFQAPKKAAEPQQQPQTLQPLTEVVGERRTADRHELDVNIVRVVINGGPEPQAVRGRVRNISTTGGMSIDTASRVPAKAAIAAELTLYDGRVMLFNGRVIRQGKQELALKLDADDTQRAFLQRFIEDARASDGRALQPVRINVKDEPAAALDDVALMKRWLEVSEQLDDDEAQQRFIQDCLRAERIEFAVARYRDLKNTRPDDERVAKYLLQLGTILSFKALSKKDAATAPAKLPGSLKMVIGFFILAGIALLLILIKVIRK